MELLEEFLVDFIGLLALALLVMPFFLPDLPGDQPEPGDPPDQPDQPGDGWTTCRTCGGRLPPNYDKPCKFFIPEVFASQSGRCLLLIKKGIAHYVSTIVL